MYNQLISYTWAKLALWHWQVRGNMPTVLLQKSYTEKCFHVHAFPPTQIDQLSNEKSKCDTNLRIIILKMGQETSELVSACFSELQQHKNIQDSYWSVCQKHCSLYHSLVAYHVLPLRQWQCSFSILQWTLLNSVKLNFCRQTNMHNVRLLCQSLPSSLTCHSTLSSCLAEHV